MTDASGFTSSAYEDADISIGLNLGAARSKCFCYRVLRLLAGNDTVPT